MEQASLPFDSIRKLDLVWIVTGYLRHIWGSLVKALANFACVNEIVSYPRKLFWGTVVIINLEFKIISVDNIGKIWAGKLS